MRELQDEARRAAETAEARRAESEAAFKRELERAEGELREARAAAAAATSEGPGGRPAPAASPSLPSAADALEASPSPPPMAARLARAEEAERALGDTLAETRAALKAKSASMAYAKNVVVQYLGLPDGSAARASLNPVLRAALSMDDDDIAALEGAATASFGGGAARIVGANVGRGGLFRGAGARLRLRGGEATGGEAPRGGGSARAGAGVIGSITALFSSPTTAPA